MKTQIAMPTVNGLNPKEEARFVQLLQKDTSDTPAELEEFKRLKRKRWAPDNHFMRTQMWRMRLQTIGYYSPELYDALVALARAAESQRLIELDFSELNLCRQRADALISKIKKEGWPQ